MKESTNTHGTLKSPQPIDDARLMLLAITHEIRSPLQNIIGYCELAEFRAQDLRDHTITDYLANIQTASEKIDHLFRSLIELYNTIKTDISREFVDLGLIANEIMDELRKSEPDRKCNINFPLGLFTCSNRELVRLLLKNLISNAWKFSADKPVANIELTRWLGKEGNYFSVSDNGCGFSEQQAAAIFLPFRSAHPKTVNSGLGLGLTLAKLIVQYHEGEIWAESTSGLGTRVIFRLDPVI